MPSSAPLPDGSNARRGSTADRGRALREAAPYLGLGTTLAITVAAGLGAGYWLDGQLGTTPWFLLLGGTLGLGTALVYFFRTVSNLSKRQAGHKR